MSEIHASLEQQTNDRFLEGLFNSVFWGIVFWTWAVFAVLALLFGILMLPILLFIVFATALSLPIAAGVSVLAYLPCKGVWIGTLRVMSHWGKTTAWLLGTAGAAVGLIGSAMLSVLLWLVENDPSFFVTTPVAMGVGVFVALKKGIVPKVTP